MKNMLAALETRLATLPVRVTVEALGGQRLGPEKGDVHVKLRSPAALLALEQGQIGSLGAAVVEGWVDLEGSMRDIMAAASALLQADPVRGNASWWSQTMARARSMALHTLERDAQQVQFHYDLSDDFYALWLDPLRVYSCAYFRSPATSLAQAQEAKLDHICRKLNLQPGERFLDIGCGWGGLIFWAAKHYGVHAKGVTLSRNQYNHIHAKIQAQGLQSQVHVELCDYRQLNDLPYDKLASVGMFEHVGQANLPAYFQTVFQLLRPGGMALIHGITAGGTRNRQLGAGMGEFIGRYIFPGGELMHVSAVLCDMAEAGLEMVDTENLRPHYARTLWEWSDALEAQLPQAQSILSAQTDGERAERALRAYRLYLAGSAMGFERGWMGLHQMLAIRPNGKVEGGAWRGTQSDYPFQRDYMYSKG
ncbi:MAG: class I SAM-dependent methyltransferase [Comamonadaceae bacterium]|nr:class I SAM-dependent methyltransferase [Comamonadaceae bacterium]